jgi:hypothetical protein
MIVWLVTTLFIVRGGVIEASTGLRGREPLFFFSGLGKIEVNIIAMQFEKLQIKSWS